jgi:hypothetical protein
MKTRSRDSSSEYLKDKCGKIKPPRKALDCKKGKA